jgi:GxxExxY protein
MNVNYLTGEIVDAAYRVHCELGPGLYESVYEAALCVELKSKGFYFEIQKPIHAVYKGYDLGLAFKADILVENQVLVELKSVEILHKVHYKQVQTYLKLSKHRYGLLFNFNEVLLKDGIHRIINGY